MPVNETFAKWAKSYSGCDGGNPERSIWLCGIEWGLSSKQYPHPKEYYKKEFRDELPTPENEFYKLDSPDDHLSYNFSRIMAKLYTAIETGTVKDYQAMAKKLFSDSTDILKINLYPVAFPNERDALWEEYGLDQITGLPSKPVYRMWCYFHRFPVFRKLVAEKKPRLIVCAGTTYVESFFSCFGDSNQVEHIHKEEIFPESENNGKARTLYWAALSADTRLAVVPFFGRPSGLNSDALIEKFGQRLKAIQTES